MPSLIAALFHESAIVRRVLELLLLLYIYLLIIKFYTDILAHQLMDAAMLRSHDQIVTCKINKDHLKLFYLYHNILFVLIV